jgi:NTE family protein
MRFAGVVGVVFLAALSAGCATIHNEPVNRPLGVQGAAAIPLGREGLAYTDDLLIGLAFSGGGTRAAAFSHGVLSELAQTPLPARATAPALIDRIDFVSGVSGGSVTAAYFGLKKRAALADFREKFLLRDAEAGLRTSVNPLTLSRALAGGINDSTGFTRWLDENLFHGATFAAFRAQRRPRIWINASDIYNRTTFVFGRTAFSAMCSDLASYPIADAVAASAAVPLVFAPVVIRTYPGQCSQPLPDWIVRARRNPSAPPMLKAFAAAVTRYHDGSMPYIKLLDGGLVDNFGLSGFTIARLSSDTPYGPLTPVQAVNLRRLMFLVADAGRGPSGNWTQTVEGPRGKDLVVAAADTAIDASVRASFTAFKQTAAEWQKALVRWRCSLSAAARRRLGAPRRWNCRDLKFFVGYLDFDQLGPARALALDQVPTRFKLEPEQVDAVIAAGRDALRANATFRSFLGSL